MDELIGLCRCIILLSQWNSMQMNRMWMWMWGWFAKNDCVCLCKCVFGVCWHSESSGRTLQRRKESNPCVGLGAKSLINRRIERDVTRYSLHTRHVS